jgi:D-aminoacyl-tRNA deacylase
MRLIVTSQKDQAGRNIYKELASEHGFRVRGDFEGSPVYEKGDIWLIATEKSQVKASHLDSFFDPEYYVFASRHRSTSEKKTLTVHTPGNLTLKAELGGRGREVALSEPSAVKVALGELRRIRDERGLDYAVSLEATHHGPTELLKPILFVEVGSTPGEWQDREAVRAVARAALKAAENRRRYEAGVGIGGNHYAPLHTRAVLETGVALGHVIPSYAIDALDKDIFRDAVVKSGATFGFLDWKGMKRSQRDKITSMAESLDLPLKRGRDLRRERLSLMKFQVDRRLLEEAWRRDARALEARLISLGCRYKKMDKGLSSIIEAKEDCREDVVWECLQILKKRGSLGFIGDELTLRFKKFSPIKAKSLGVEPGPLYARLAEGGEVRLRGRVVKPDMVHEAVQKKIKISDAFTVEAIKNLLGLKRDGSNAD